MSLPAGVVNRPPAAASPPVVVAGLARIVLALLGLLLPLLLQAAAQVPGLVWQKDAARLEERLARLREERRRYAAERASLLRAERLRREAERLGLGPAPPGAGPLVLRREGRP
ncbi:MAG: hypothetical protein D6718_04840 [Acidobacteria bacterium]|nr:MAG: hypothetical protein D6718_04840 [Acidobacteriota bacterium]